MVKNNTILKSITLIALLVLTIVISGCGNDVSTGSYKANFGSNVKDKALLEQYQEIYGDLSNSGEPQILDAFTTTEIIEYIPSNYVIKWSKDEQFINLWFVYDNFEEGDELMIIWTYYGEYDEGPYEIIDLPLITGEDFGRGMSTLESPDEGWPLGNYQVLISWSDGSFSVPFVIYNGPTEKEILVEYNDEEQEESEFEEETLDDVKIQDDLDITVDEWGRRFKTYRDANWDVEFLYPEKYTYVVEEGDVIFESEDSVMYFVFNVLLTDKNGGTFSSYDDVYMDYREQFGIWGDDDHMWSGSKLSDRTTDYLHKGFALHYELADGEKWNNFYYMVEAGDYYYVMQFNYPYGYQSEVIGDEVVVIESFKTSKAEKNIIDPMAYMND